MRIAVVDDEKIVLDGIMRIILRCMPDAEVRGYQIPEQALEALVKEPADVVFVDIDMPFMDGISFARKLKARCPTANIVFSTAYPQYTAQAMDLHASGYLLKPVTEAKICRELEDLRYPVAYGAAESITIKAFGNFEAFYKGEPLRFRYSKTRELLAFLVDRCGVCVTNQEIQAVLWDDDTDKTSYLKQLRKDLTDRFDECGCGDALIRRRGSLGIVQEKGFCDYFEWLRGTARGINAYHGEYMSQFAWAKDTHAAINLKQGLV